MSLAQLAVNAITGVIAWAIERSPVNQTALDELARREEVLQRRGRQRRHRPSDIPRQAAWEPLWSRGPPFAPDRAHGPLEDLSIGVRAWITAS